MANFEQEGFLNHNLPFLSDRARHHHVVFSRSNSFTPPYLVAPDLIFEHTDGGKQQAEDEARKMNKSLFKDEEPHRMEEGGYEVKFLEEGQEYDGPSIGNPYSGPEGYVGVGVYRHGVNDGKHMGFIPQRLQVDYPRGL